MRKPHPALAEQTEGLDTLSCRKKNTAQLPLLNGAQSDGVALPHSIRERPEEIWN